MRKLSVGILGAFASVFATSATACDVEYVVQEGDTLPAIATAAYGETNYQLIFARNFGVLTSPSSLPVGTTIIIPCIEGDAAMTPDADALAARQAEGGQVAIDPNAAEEESEPVVEAAEEDAPAAAPVETVKAPEPEAEPDPAPVAEAPKPTAPVAAIPRGGYRLLTANGQAPYADRSLRGGGMVTELIGLSLANTGHTDDYKVVFIDDRSVHLTDLLLEGSFDVGFPWLRPRCDEMDVLRDLSPEQAWMCESFDFSEPFYEYVNGFFVRKGEFSANRTTFADFSGGSICRPAGEPTEDLAVKGLASDGIELVAPASVADCFALLMTEEVDAVSVEIFAAEEVLADADLFAQVEELPNLSLLWTVHAVAAKGKPEAANLLAALNKGLLDLKVSGQWFRVVARHLAAQNGG